MNNYDLEQLYIHKIAGSKIISEAANNPFGTSPYGVGSRIKRALTPFMSKTAQRSEVKSQRDINDMYDKFVAALAKVGKREGDAKYGDLTAYLAKLINASAATSKTWDQLNVNPTQTFNTFGALSLGNAFKRIVEEVNQSSLTAPTPPGPTPPGPRRRRAAKKRIDITKENFLNLLLARGYNDPVERGQIVDMLESPEVGVRFKKPPTP